MAEAACDLVLVTMPFGPLLQPSLALSLLRGVTAPAGIAVRIEYLTIDFAARLGVDSYLYLADGDLPPSLLAGERVFVDALFPGELHHDADPVLDAARRLVEPFLDDALRRVLRGRPRVVGFSSVFQQHLASLALASRIKAEAPATVIVFGGANCEGPMGEEILARFPAVDVVVPGEGEIALPALMRRVLDGERYDGLPGLLTRRTLVPAAAPEVDLDSLPPPDYDDYFAQLRLGLPELSKPPRLLFESARGCWWGQRRHCTFCGLNGGRMRFRSKSPDRVLAEIVGLRDRYPGLVIGAVDNILDMDYFSTLLPALASSGTDLALFYEVKANLRKDQVRLLRDAGIRDIQPGVESLSDSALGLMRKGVSALQNIQLLKWCVELGVRPVWNIIWGFPGEDPAEYERMAELMPLISHLPPPSTAGPVRIDRFSPLFEEPEAHGIVASEVAAAEAYRHLYPFPAESIHRLAYYFEAPAVSRESDRYAAVVSAAVAEWQRVHESSALFSVHAGDRLLVWDMRREGPAALTELGGVQRAVYLACDRCRDLAALRRLVPEGEDVVGALEDLVGQGLMVERNGVYLSLAVPVGEYQPGLGVLARLAAALSPNAGASRAGRRRPPGHRTAGPRASRSG